MNNTKFTLFDLLYEIVEDWVKDEIEMGNDMFNTDSDTLNMLYQFQHELYQEDKEEGLI